MTNVSPANRLRRSRLAVFGIFTLLCCCGFRCGIHKPTPAAQPQHFHAGETIVLIRHGEKPVGGLGQLTCRGWNRALALPGVLLPRFGTPAALFAPDPGAGIKDGDAFYSYVRPLATIEPTAIQLGLPVNTKFPYQSIDALATEVTAPAYANSTVFIVWEHVEAYKFAELLLRSHAQDPGAVPPWPSDDYEMVYVFHISPPAPGTSGPGALHFEVQGEGLEGSLASTCPGAQPQT